MDDKFKEADKEKVIEFLNFIDDKAVFNGISLKENIRLYALLVYMQKELLPKIDSHVLEVINIVEEDNKEE